MKFDVNSTNDIDKLWSCWKKSFLDAVNNHIPTKTIKDTNSLPWVDKEVRHLIRKKYSALKRYRQNKCKTRKQKLRSLRDAVKLLIKKKHKEYVRKIETSFAIIRNLSGLTTKQFIDFSIRLNFQRTKSAARQIYNFKEADFEGLNNTLSQMKFDVADLYNSGLRVCIILCLLQLVMYIYQ